MRFLRLYIYIHTHRYMNILGATSSQIEGHRTPFKFFLCFKSTLSNYIH